MWHIIGIAFYQSPLSHYLRNAVTIRCPIVSKLLLSPFTLYKVTEDTLIQKYYIAEEIWEFMKYVKYVRRGQFSTYIIWWHISQNIYVTAQWQLSSYILSQNKHFQTASSQVKVITLMLYNVINMSCHPCVTLRDVLVV